MLVLSVAGFLYWSAACCDPLWSLATGYWSLLPLLRVRRVPILCLVLEVASPSHECKRSMILCLLQKKLSSLNTEKVIFHGDTADIWFKSPQFPLSVTSCPHSCLFLSWLEEFFHSDTDLCLGPLSFGMAANRNLQNFLCLSLLIFCYLEECGCEINFLLTTGFGHPALRPVRVTPVGLRLLSVPFACYICILAVSFIWLFIWPKPWCLGNSLKGLRSIRIAWKEVVACSQRRREEFFPSL